MRRTLLTPRPAALAGAALIALAGSCARPGTCRGDYCGTLVFVTGASPDVLLPAVTDQTTSRDIDEQMFLKLADVGPSENTVGDADFQPQLAQRWEWANPRTLVFHLNPRARWQDGAPVTAQDVVFTFDAYTDTVVGSPARSHLAQIASVTARDSLTAVFTFRSVYPEMFFDAVYHMFVLPRHLLLDVPRGSWRTAAFGRAPVGDGPYRFVHWTPNESVELAADSMFFLGRPHIRRLIWRITPNLQVAVTQLVADQADALEYLGPPEFVKQASQAPQLTLYPYKGSSYGYLAFNLRANGDPRRPHPILADRAVRRALTMAVDRAALLENVFGTYARVPPGPMPEMWWIWALAPAPLPYDTAAADRLLTARGWVDSDHDGIRDRHGVPLRLTIIVPSSSNVRERYARLLQEAWRAVGVDLRIASLDPTTAQARIMNGRFDAALLAWNADPAPGSSLGEHWTSGGSTNVGHYANPAFDRLLARATRTAPTPAAATDAWRAALDTLDADAPGIWLFAPDNIAAIHKRVADVVIRPDSWWALVWRWRIPADRLLPRDRAGQ